MMNSLASKKNVTSTMLTRDYQVKLEKVLARTSVNKLHLEPESLTCLKGNIEVKEKSSIRKFSMYS